MPASAVRKHASICSSGSGSLCVCIRGRVTDGVGEVDKMNESYQVGSRVPPLARTSVEARLIDPCVLLVALLSLSCLRPVVCLIIVEICYAIWH